MQLKLVRAQLKDIETIQGLADVAFRDTYKDIHAPYQTEYMLNMMYSAESLNEQICGQGKDFFLIEDGETIVGYASLERDGMATTGKPLFHLQKIYLLPVHHHKGYGKKAFVALTDYAKAIAPEGFRLELNVNRYNKAVGFYEAMGMRRDREGDFEIGNGFYMNDYIYCMDC